MDKERIFDWNLNGFADGRSRTGLDSIDHLRDQLTSARISFTSGQIKEELEFLENAALHFAEERIKVNFGYLKVCNRWLDLLGQIPIRNSMFVKLSNKARIKAFVELVFKDMRQNKNRHLYDVKVVNQVTLNEFIYDTFEDIKLNHPSSTSFMLSEEAADLNIEELGMKIKYLVDDPYLEDVEAKWKEGEGRRREGEKFLEELNHNLELNRNLNKS